MGNFDWVPKFFGARDRDVYRDLEERFEKTGPGLRAEAEAWELTKTQSLTNSTVSTDSQSPPQHPQPVFPRLPHQGSLRGPSRPLLQLPDPPPLPSYLTKTPGSSANSSDKSVRPALDRSQSDVGTKNAKPLDDNIIGSSVFAGGITEAQKKRNYSYDKVWDADNRADAATLLPPMVGMGKYRRSQDADEDFQVDMLRKSFVNLPAAAASALQDSDVAGFDPAIISQYQEQRRQSDASARSGSSSRSQVHCLDPRDGAVVVRGFGGILIGFKSSGESDTSSHRKDSDTSMTSVSSQGVSDQRQRRKSRQRSMPVSEGSTLSQLSTISEAPDTLSKPQRKIEKPLKFDIDGDPDSALASDVSEDESEGDWGTIPNSPAKGGLSKMVQQAEELKASKAVDRQKPRHQRASSQHVHKAERSKTVKKTAGPNVRRRIPHQIPTTMEEAPANEGDKDEVVSKMLEDGARFTKREPQPEIEHKEFAKGGSSDEAGEHPADLHMFMVGAKRNEREESKIEDDKASTRSTSTVQTVVPASRRVTPVPQPIAYPRQRSDTAFRVGAPDRDLSPIAACEDTIIAHAPDVV